VESFQNPREMYARDSLLSAVSARRWRVPNTAIVARIPATRCVALMCA